MNNCPKRFMRFMKFIFFLLTALVGFFFVEEIALIYQTRLITIDRQRTYTSQRQPIKINIFDTSTQVN